MATIYLVTENDNKLITESGNAYIVVDNSTPSANVVTVDLTSLYAFKIGFFPDRRK